MNTSKKHQSLSLSISDFLADNPAATEYSTPSFSVVGRQFLTFQFNFQELDASDAVLNLEQSLDNTNFCDLLDCLGAPVSIVLDEDEASVTLNLNLVNTAFIKATVTFNSVTEGYLSSYIYLTT
ncbi:MAG: hypothetical protein WCO13_12650 [Bacteroidota bacterium]